MLSAYLVVERNTVCRGKPCISISIGNVIRLSTSVGDSPGALTITCTCGAAISGNASMGRLLKAHTPAAVSTVASNKTINRWIREKRIREAIISYSLPAPYCQWDLSSATPLLTTFVSAVIPLTIGTQPTASAPVSIAIGSNLPLPSALKT